MVRVMVVHGMEVEDLTGLDLVHRGREGQLSATTVGEWGIWLVTEISQNVPKMPITSKMLCC